MLVLLSLSSILLALSKLGIDCYLTELDPGILGQLYEVRLIYVPASWDSRIWKQTRGKSVNSTMKALPESLSERTPNC